MSTPLTCLHFLSEVRLELGGVVQAVLDLCQAVAEQGHRVVLATCDASDVPQAWRDGAPGTPRVVTVASSAWGKPMRSCTLSRQGLATLADEIAGADIAHLHTPWELANFQLRPLLRRRRTPYVVTPHGMLDDWSMQQKAAKKKFFLKLFGRRLFADAAGVHLTAEGELVQARRWVPIDDRGFVAPLVMDLAPYDHPPGAQVALEAFPQISPEKTKLLFLSRLHPKKGVEVLIEAGAILRDEGLPVELLIAGPGDEPYLGQLHALTERLNLTAETHFLGMVRGDAKRSLFEVADAFVLPTHQENFGLAITEAMACGTPVVTTRGTDIWPEVQRGGGRIADHNPPAFADQLRDFFTDPTLRDRLGGQGREFVRRWLDRQSVTGAYEQLYRQAISSANL